MGGLISKNEVNCLENRCCNRLKKPPHLFVPTSCHVCSKKASLRLLDCGHLLSFCSEKCKYIYLGNCLKCSNTNKYITRCKKVKKINMNDK